MIKISHKKPHCTGCLLCVEVAPNYWKVNNEGLAQLRQVDSTRNDFQVTEGFEEDRALLEEAESGCPVGIIKLQK